MSFTGHHKIDLFFQERAFGLYSIMNPVGVAPPIDEDFSLTKENFLRVEKDLIQAELCEKGE